MAKLTRLAPPVVRRRAWSRRRALLAAFVASVVAAVALGLAFSGGGAKTAPPAKTPPVRLPSSALAQARALSAWLRVQQG